MNNPTNSDPVAGPLVLVDRYQLAARYSVCLRTVDNWRAMGHIPSVRLPGGRLIRFPLQACDDIILGPNRPQTPGTRPEPSCRIRVTRVSES